MSAQTLDYHVFVGMQYIFIEPNAAKADLRPKARLCRTGMSCGVAASSRKAILFGEFTGATQCLARVRARNALFLQ
jgi:hypothetical protein